MLIAGAPQNAFPWIIPRIFGIPGWLCDKLNSKLAIAVSIALASTATSLLPSVANWSVFGVMAVRFIVGACEAFVQVPNP